MSLALGKRKRRQDVDKKRNVASEESDDDATARALFQRAFEKKFKPLETSEKPAEERKPAIRDDSEDDEEDDDDDEDGEDGDDSEPGSDDDEDDFSGFSGSEDNEITTIPAKPQIEVIEDRIFRRADPAEEKRLKKQFMSSKIPSTPQYPIAHKPSATAAAAATDSTKDEDEKDNLQNDLALQRLLKESHLLDANTFSANGSASSAPEGAARLRALDMRIRDLGGKKSHLDQDRMPIAFRKGMVAKASEREDKRRTEAKENGIILERFGAKTRGGAGAAARGGGRERKSAIGTGGPDIGTYRGATLRLSKNDIKGMEGSKRGGKGGRGGRGGKKKGPMKFGSGF